MEIIKAVGENIDNILVVLIFTIGIAISALKWVQVNGPLFAQMSTSERIAYITRLLENLSSIALALVTNAEQIFGSGTGKLKRAYVLDQLYSRIPDEYKKYVNEANLDVILEQALAEAKVLWDSNEKMNALVAR